MRAVDQAGLRDATPAEYTWTVNGGDETPPDTSIGQKPPTATTATSATFTFTATESGSTFQCKRVTSGSSSGWREWNVAAIVQAMLTSSNYGFVIRDANEDQDGEQQYNSREKGSDTPQLVLTFKPAP